MPQKTVITKIKELGEDSGIRIFFPQNRMLYADQFTGYSPDTAEEQAVFSPTTIDGVFDHYKPCVEGIYLSNEDGDARYEDFRFGGITDFDDEHLIAQSETLSNSVYKRDTYYTLINLLERNRDLRRLISEPEDREALKKVFMAMRKELSETKEG
jgi:hypothetical protein